MATRMPDLAEMEKGMAIQDLNDSVDKGLALVEDRRRVFPADGGSLHRKISLGGAFDGSNRNEASWEEFIEGEGKW